MDFIKFIKRIIFIEI